MTDQKEIVLSDWSHFIRFASLLDGSDPFLTPYAFRGQSNSNWELMPSLLRYLQIGSVNEQAALKIESLALNEFKAQAHLHLSNAELNSTIDTFSWWTVMQHHGAPTRLLDWTASIYVAAYFAVVGSPTADGAIWFVHINEAKNQMEKKFEPRPLPSTEQAIQKEYLKENLPNHISFTGRKNKSHRMIAQQGFFSVSRNVLGSHDEALASLFPGNEPKEYFRKLVVPSRLKKEFIRKLRRMNVTASSLYPGLDGVGKSINELVQAAL